MDPLLDGHCQFAAMADVLTIMGIFKSARSLRQEVNKDLLEICF